MISDLSSKLSHVMEQIPKDVLYDFLCSYAQSHEELAMALENEFWQAEKDDYRSMVQQCLMHPSPAEIAREVAEEIVNENPNKPFKRLFESAGVINGTQRHEMIQH